VKLRTKVVSLAHVLELPLYVLDVTCTSRVIMLRDLFCTCKKQKPSKFIKDWFNAVQWFMIALPDTAFACNISLCIVPFTGQKPSRKEGVSLVSATVAATYLAVRNLGCNECVILQLAWAPKGSVVSEEYLFGRPSLNRLRYLDLSR